jgi:hypothetical protein
MSERLFAYLEEHPSPPYLYIDKRRREGQQTITVTPLELETDVSLEPEIDVRY